MKTPEETKTYNAAYYVANSEKIKANTVAWRAANPEMNPDQKSECWYLFLVTLPVSVLALLTFVFWIFT